ncbi:MAG: DegT/DnrJ/EryC1/StrS family aminotransferase [Bacteroidales bacterium]|nr:DegT/DnrJ/EryC1/StrS family aminotransferase [Bacteroidales bacterium]
MNKLDRTEEIKLMKPYMPPLHEFQPYLECIWESRRLTNGGTIHSEFEKALCNYLSVNHICLFANGTTALIIALKALNLKGEIITTPFTSVATAQSIYWNNLKPVFVDINETDLNINISEIERAITPNTTAILPVHIFGNPCNVDSINQLAQKYNLRVVYDAAHCFGVQLNGTSLCNFGDLSVLSFHATKVFNTVEGGAIICHDKATKNYIDALKNFGQTPDYKLAGYGLNAKMNEIQSAFGLVELKYVDKVIAYRKTATLKYRELLENVKGLRLINDKKCVKHNYTYFPVIINSEEFGASRDELLFNLKSKNIFARKYFHPLITDYPEFNIYKTSDLPIARKIADNVICLPLFHDISFDEQTAVVDSIYQMH